MSSNRRPNTCTGSPTPARYDAKDIPSADSCQEERGIPTARDNVILLSCQHLHFSTGRPSESSVTPGSGAGIAATWLPGTGSTFDTRHWTTSFPRASCNLIFASPCPIHRDSNLSDAQIHPPHVGTCLHTHGDRSRPPYRRHCFLQNADVPVRVYPEYRNVTIAARPRCLPATPAANLRSTNCATGVTIPLIISKTRTACSVSWPSSRGKPGVAMCCLCLVVDAV